MLIILYYLLGFCMSRDAALSVVLEEGGLELTIERFFDLYSRYLSGGAWPQRSEVRSNQTILDHAFERIEEVVLADHKMRSKITAYIALKACQAVLSERGMSDPRVTVYGRQKEGDDRVSEMHSLLVECGNGAVLIDLGSNHGTSLVTKTVSRSNSPSLFDGRIKDPREVLSQCRSPRPPSPHPQRKALSVSSITKSSLIQPLALPAGSEYTLRLGQRLDSATVTIDPNQADSTASQQLAKAVCKKMENLFDDWRNQFPPAAQRPSLGSLVAQAKESFIEKMQSSVSSEPQTLCFKPVTPGI